MILNWLIAEMARGIIIANSLATFASNVNLLMEFEDMRIILFDPNKLCKVMVPVILSLMLCVSCQNQASSENKLQRSDLNFLVAGMSYEKIVDHIGEADRDVGSGIYAFQYDLDDGSILTLQFVHLDHLDRATVQEPDGDFVVIVP